MVQEFGENLLLRSRTRQALSRFGPRAGMFVPCREGSVPRANADTPSAGMLRRMSLFATKPLERVVGPDADASALRPVLGPANLIALGIGAVIGAGIFVITGQAAGANAGPAVVLSMLLAGVVSAL